MKITRDNPPVTEKVYMLSEMKPGDLFTDGKGSNSLYRKMNPFRDNLGYINDKVKKEELAKNLFLVYDFDNNILNAWSKDVRVYPVEGTVVIKDIN